MYSARKAGLPFCSLAIGIWKAWPGADSCKVSAGRLYKARDGRS
ncbi:MAG TPA: hypothetical protein VGP06_11640 [Janthinobacterium sp.]|nr:hypothetical protein [Janthinobacterium sp.]